MDPAIRITTDAQNVLTIWMDLPGKPVNTCSSQLLDELAEAIDVIVRDSPTAVILASAKPRSFNAGADLFEIREMSPRQIEAYLARGQSLLDRIARLAVPTIAAIGGDCLGGGCELALACRYRVAADDFSISIGLPEVKLGLIPAWGGSTRLPRLIGLRRALPILLAGKTMPPRKAQRAGMVDEVVRPEALLSAAKRIVLSGARPHRPGRIDRVAARLPVARNRILSVAREKTLNLTHGNYPAPIAVLGIVRTGYQAGFGAGLEAERNTIIKLIDTDAGRNLLRLFFLRQGAKKLAAASVSAHPHEVKYAAVIGGGTMGAGIVHALIRSGIAVRLVEVDPPAISSALGRIKRMLDEDVAAGRLDRLAARHAFNRVSPTSDWTGLELADFVVEAVLETIQAKRQVFSKLDRLTRPTTVLASNTSSLRLADIAQATLHPDRVIGLHFFNPVPRMSLVEIVRGPASDDASLATAIALAVRIGKTPVVVNDSPGFLVNRILLPYLSQAVGVASQGTPINLIDRAMESWGMPMGPFALLDEIGLDIAAHVLASIADGTTKQPNAAAMFARAQDRHWLGKKSGVGFYTYPAKHRPSAALPINHDLIHVLTGGKQMPVELNEPARQALRESIQWRLVLPMVNEAARVLEEHVTDSTDTIDLAMVLGAGVLRFRGGTVQFANSVGTEQIVLRLEEMATEYGNQFAPARLLCEAARERRPVAAPAQTEHDTRSTQRIEYHGAEGS